MPETCPLCDGPLIERGHAGPSDVGEWNEESWLECRRCSVRLEFAELSPPEERRAAAAA